MEQFDKLMKETAEKEEMIVPNGFDERVQAALNGLPPKQKKRKPGAAKVALIAAAACLLLVGTALAASQELRGMLMDALGSFAPYAHEQEDNTYTVDGFELKVLSTLTDGSVIRAYVQVKDLEGHRLSADMMPLGFIHLVDVNGQTPDSIVEYGPSDNMRYAVYDEETETALLIFTDWGEYFSDPSTAMLSIFNINDFDPGANEGPVPPLIGIPLTAKATDKLTFDEASELAGYLGAKRVELSPLGITAVFEYDRAGAPADPLEELMDKVMTDCDEMDMDHVQPVRVRMKDGTELYRVVEHNSRPSKEAFYSDSAGDFYGVIRIWTFTDAIDLEQVEGIFMYGEYFPVN